MMLYYGIPLTTAVAFLPIVLIVHLMLTIGVALLFALANLFYRDVKYLFEIVITVWMFMTSVLYPIAAVQGRLARVMYLNPMTPIIDGYRDVLLLGRSPLTTEFAIAALISFFVLSIGWLVFHRAEFSFAEGI
jgi:ABC-type polysaccharide/polyol phosphate export permease